MQHIQENTGMYNRHLELLYKTLFIIFALYVKRVSTLWALHYQLDTIYAGFKFFQFYPLMVLFFWGVYHACEIQKVFFYLLCLIPVLSVIKHGVWHLPEPILSKIQQQFESLGIPGCK